MPSASSLELNLRLLSPGQLLAIPLGMVGVTFVLFLITGSVAPRFEASCQRDEAAAGSCVLREWTFLSSHEQRVELSNTRFELEDVRSAQRGRSTVVSHLRVRSDDGATAFETGLRGGPAIKVAQAVKRFRETPTLTTLEVSEGFSAGFFLVMLPALLLLSLGPVWGLGGSLVVKANDQQLSVTRVRPFWKQDRVVSFVPPARPLVELTRGTGRYRTQGTLAASAPGQARVVLVAWARFELLEPVERQLTAHYAAMR